MADAPELSVVIVSYECRDELLDALDDLQAVRAEVPLEVLLVDNGSTDGTVAAVGERFRWVDVRVRPDNPGFAVANNDAIRRARGRWVLILNPDTRIGAAAVRACLDELARDARVGILSPKVVGDDGRLDPNCRRGFPTVWSVFCHVTGLERRLGGRRSRRYTQGWLGEDEAGDVEAVSGAVMFCRADALAAVGGFDERFFMYGEDIDLCLRVARAGWRVRYWPGATITHLGGRSGMSPRARRAWARSIGDLHRLHYPGWRGRVGGWVCDVGGRVLSARPSPVRRRG